MTVIVLLVPAPVELARVTPVNGSITAPFVVLWPATVPVMDGPSTVSVTTVALSVAGVVGAPLLTTLSPKVVATTVFGALVGWNTRASSSVVITVGEAAARV